MFKDYVHMHIIIFIWGFTAILGKLITIPAVEIVLYRTAIAATGTAMVMALMNKGGFRLPSKTIWGLIGTGTIIALHWITFFAAAQISSVSICLTGLSTTTLWTSLIDPLLSKRQVKWYEVFLGALIIAGLYVIFHFEFNHLVGLLLAIFSAFCAALFSVINAHFTQKHHHYTITFYEMLGAFASCVLFLPMYANSEVLSGGNGLQLIPTASEAFYIFLLGGLCTVYAYTAMVELMRRIPVFAANLSINLEPIYGILLAIPFFNEHEMLSSGFYIGTVVILIAVGIYPIFKQWDDRRIQKIQA